MATGVGLLEVLVQVGDFEVAVVGFLERFRPLVVELLL